ncbi:hypothetical protein [Rudanella lutea]|uniref:hypothetical protein n=1 Tax=Rudanella lutea TaxID=451374 RepID=UPI0003668EE7|nr:hypothetical protein [Rudanella lutea]
MAIDCSADPIGSLKQMFVDKTMGPRILAGQQPVRRAVFLRPHGVAYGTFTVNPDLPDTLKIGVFSYPSFACWVRFSSDTLPLLPDQGTTLGLSIKLIDVPGRKLLPGEEDATTQDFTLQFIDRFFVPNATEMCAFTQAGVVGHNYDTYLNSHPVTQAILNEMDKSFPDVLATPYWSCLPYAFGEGEYVKYKVTASVADQPGDVPTNNPNYLHDRLRGRLLEQPVTLTFSVQFRRNPATMPLDDATVAWSEQESPPVPVATITLPVQDIDAPGQAAFGENLAFNSWHALPEHAPVGSLNEVRKVVYQASAELRRYLNGVPVGEPTVNRPPHPPSNVIPQPASK